MSSCGAAIRNGEGIAAAQAAAREELKLLMVEKSGDLSWRFRLRDMLISQIMYLGAMSDYIREGGGSRGSALYTGSDVFTFALDDDSRKTLIQEAAWNDGEPAYTWRSVRPIPEDDDFFENVWRSYRENGNIV